jgi:predicted outer membrane protein
MKQRMIRLLVVAATVLVFSTTVWSADTTTGTGGAKLSGSDANFVKEASQGGLIEVQLGKIAQSKAANESVKDFGKRMEQDHSKANDELKKIAADKGVQISTELDKTHKSSRQARNIIRREIRPGLYGRHGRRSQNRYKEVRDCF